MNLTRLLERFPATHHALVKDLGAVLVACRTFAQPTTRLPDPTSGPIDFEQYLDFAMSVYSDKFLQLYDVVAESLLSERYLIYAQSARSILENAATLRYYSRDSDVTQLRTSEQSSPEMIAAALSKIDLLIRGSRFSWEAFIAGRFDELRAEPDYQELRQTHVQTCLDHWSRESPTVKSLYSLLCDMVHPNLGSSLLVIRTDDGSLLAGGEGGAPASAHLVYPTLAGTLGAFKIIQRSFQELDASRPKPNMA